MKIARVIQAGLTIGITIFQKIQYSLAPSTRAASSMESGMVIINCRIRNTPKEPDRAGSTSDQKVLMRCRRLMMIYRGVRVTSGRNRIASTTIW